MKILFIISALLLVSAFGFDLSEYGDFSSRSVIMNKLNNPQNINQELKDILNSKKLTPTHQCLFEQIKKGNIDNVNLLLQAKVNPNESYMSEYAIHYASKLNNFDMVKLLFENGAKLDKGFYSELFEAVKNNNKEMARFFLDNGARVNYNDSISGNSILYYALKNNMQDIAIELYQKGARVDKKTFMLIKKKKLINVFEERTN